MRKVTYPQEVEVWYVLPAIRKQIAIALLNKGMNQKEVAKILGITEASISHYKKDKRATIDISKIPNIKKEVEEAVEKIIKDNSLIASEVMRINRIIKLSGLTCKLYKEHSILEECNMPCQSCEHKETSKHC